MKNKPLISFLTLISLSTSALKASSVSWDFVDCLQMHNPSNIFSLDGKSTKSKHIPGWIDYYKQIELNNNEALLIVLANEREEKIEEKILYARTHYKSDALKINNKVLIPSMNPDKNDLSDAPLWFDPNGDKQYCNYYEVWENASINIALVLPHPSNYLISFFNKNNKLIITKKINVSKEPMNIKFDKIKNIRINSYALTEIDGGAYKKKDMVDADNKVVRDMAIYKIIIQSESGDIIEIPLPYPAPYINRIYITSK